MRKYFLILFAICAGSVPGAVCEETLLILFAICAGSVPGAVCEEIFTYSCSLICAGRVS